MDDEQADHLNDDQEQYAGDPVDDDAAVEPRYGAEASFTPRPGTRVDGGWRPDDHPHGDPRPGPSLDEDPGARGPQARSALPANPPVPPEAGPGPDPDRVDTDGAGRG